MFLEKIGEQLFEEIESALYEEHRITVENWDGQLIDLDNEDFEDIVRSEIFSDYLNIPLNMLEELINRHFPFLKEKDIGISPFSDFIVSEDDDNKEVLLKVYADFHPSDKEMLSEIELRKLNKLLEKLTLLYENLDVETTLFINHIPLEDVPDGYYDEDDASNDFVQIGF
ncbi:hypothetical protein [Sporosarcina obsidiansis]|uniref:hypothetical protein n=1 Tax=Sporosarcina obsidiansis TaxID=2660748 RepID=UPI00129B5145|nr:hypothetical protein [Sporosarcina obsidiansis]